MKPGNRREVEEIFHQALQHNPAQRDAFVREACHGDSELHGEVSSLLAHHDEGVGFEQWAAMAAAALAATALAAAWRHARRGVCIDPLEALRHE